MTQENGRMNFPMGDHRISVTLREGYRRQGKMWSEDLITVDVDGEEAGYMVLSHIPKAILAQAMPRGIIDYAAYQKGHCSLRVLDDELPLAVRSHLGLPVDASNKAVAAKLKARHGKDWDSFRAFFVDKPFVAYTRVYSEHDHYTGGAGRDADVRRHRLVNYRRMGLGGILYQEAAHWLSRRGWALHADDNQTGDAHAVWNYLQREFAGAISVDEYGPGRTRLKLDGNLLEATRIPAWADGMDVHEMPALDPFSEESQADIMAARMDAQIAASQKP